MPIMTGTVALAANSNSQNVLAQLPFEFISNIPSAVRVNFVTDVPLVNATFQSGGETLMQDSLVFVNTKETPMDTFKDYLKFLAAPGERLFLTFQNGPNACNIFWSVEILPVG